MTNAPHNSAPRILIVRLSAIGDTVLTMPVANALRRHFPNAWIAWLVQGAGASLVKGHAALDEVITIRRDWMKSPAGIWNMRRMLRERRFDITVDAQGLTKSALPAWLSGARTRIGYAAGELAGRELSPWLNNIRVRPERSHVVERHLELLKPLGIEQPAVEFRVPEHAADIATVDRFLVSAGVTGPFAVINPGAGWNSKLWPAERFGQVAAAIGSERRVPSVVVWAGDEELTLARQIVERSAGHARLAPKTTLTELAAFCRRARMFVGSDTGPLHIAAAVGTPCVGLYGPMPASHCGPFGTQHEVLQNATIHGSSRQRRSADNATMQAITADEVIAACQRVLNRPRSIDRIAA